MNKHNIFLAATASLLFITACGSDETSSADTAAVESGTDTTAADDVSPDASASDGAAVGIKDSRYDPSEIEIVAGESVTFTNNDGFDHTVTSKDDSTIEYDSGTFGKDETFEQAFAEPGSYSFFCQIHPTMRGTVTVG